MKNKNIILLVGAGAVENAWEPVVRAINNVANDKITAENANIFFANLIYLARFYSKISHPDAPKNLEYVLDNLKVLKKEICSQLIMAQRIGEIKPRPTLVSLLKRYINFPGYKISLVSTNWDTVIENSINEFYGYKHKIKCLHIHGDVNSDIYLPTEITSEIYKNNDEEFNFGKKHSSFLHALENSNTLIIYGLSMSPLDAELLQIVAGSCAFIEEIIIINPDHQRVISNLHAVIQHNVILTGVCPSELAMGS